MDEIVSELAFFISFYCPLLHNDGNSKISGEISNKLNLKFWLETLDIFWGSNKRKWGNLNAVFVISVRKFLLNFNLFDSQSADIFYAMSENLLKFEFDVIS